MYQTFFDNSLINGFDLNRSFISSEIILSSIYLIPYSDTFTTSAGFEYVIFGFLLNNTLETLVKYKPF